MFGDRAIHQLLRARLQSKVTSRFFSSLLSKKGHEGSESATKSHMSTVALLGAGVSGLLSLATFSSCDEAEHGLESPSYPWPHAGILSSYDHSSSGGLWGGRNVWQQRLHRGSWGRLGQCGYSALNNAVIAACSAHTSANSSLDSLRKAVWDACMSYWKLNNALLDSILSSIPHDSMEP